MRRNDIDNRKREQTSCCGTVFRTVVPPDESAAEKLLQTIKSTLIVKLSIKYF